MNRKWLLSALLALAPAVAGCKQGIGERCQKNEDCSSDVCSTSDPRVCQPAGTGVDAQISAELPKDAAPPDDAPATDASVDAAP